MAPGLARNTGETAIVAIPARNEEERIEACLTALEAQNCGTPFSVLVLANNCSDRTADIVRAFATRSALTIHLFDVRLPSADAHAGLSRRLAMNAASHLLDEEGVILSTDGDSRCDPNWVRENLAELAAGADIVCGMICPDMAESALLPPYVQQRGVQEFLYERMTTELESIADPLPWDSWPRHRMETGASLALRAGVYVEVGGVPNVQPAEDRALVALVRRHGGSVRHSFAPQVVTSCRLDGRARGGWADDLADRVRNPMGRCHDVLEPAFDLFRRASLRHAMRKVWPSPDLAAWSMRLRISSEALAALRAFDFEDAWDEIEALSPRLTRRLLCMADLPAETRRMEALLARSRRVLGVVARIGA
jgi:hypothetical protein